MLVTMLVAALIGALVVLLSFRVTAIRRRDGIAMGDGGNPELLARMRAHANLIEVAPIGLVLLFLLEQQWGSAWFVWTLGLMLVASRVLHPVGMARPAPNVPRVAGTMLGWTMIGVASILLLIRVVQLAGAGG